tara:strand:- start:1128 stop:1352 length:225 start_codon:yes stop_codon:yes gene_type:complete
MRTLYEKLKDEPRKKLNEIKKEAPASYNYLIGYLQEKYFYNLKVSDLCEIIFWLSPSLTQYDIYKSKQELFYDE